MKNSEKYMSCREVKKEDCPLQTGKWCGTCMYRDNERSSDGFKLDELESGVYDFCRKKRR